MTMSIQTHVERENFVKIAQLLYFQWQICGKIRNFQFFCCRPTHLHKQRCNMAEGSGPTYYLPNEYMQYQHSVATKHDDDH